jgi:TolA-binding protein
LVELAREGLPGELTPREQAGLARLEGRVFLAPPAGAVKRWSWALGALAAGAAATYLATSAMRPPSDVVSFRVEGGTVSDSGYIRQNDGPTAVHFSEGTEFALSPGSRARVTNLDAHGARVLLESGKARVHVTPRPRARWSVDAGPYTIRVTGTAFDVAWAGGDEVLDLALHNGSVVVTGPLAAQGLVMEPGQHLVANVKAGVIRLDRPPGSEHAAEAEGPASDSTAATTGEQGPEEMPEGATPARVRHLPAHRAPGHLAAGEPGGAEAAGSSWAARLSRGEFEAVVAAAERRGIDRTLEQAPGEDLAALADAARYARRTELAQRALLAELRRFPRSAGRDAAFFLGGLVEERPGMGPASVALDWYERYLRQSPRGTYASQALGRKMAMEERLGRADQARAVAGEYLEQFPKGPYAERARALLGAK